MKKSIILINLFVAGLIFANLNKTEAQTTVSVLQGSTHTYSVTPNPGNADYNYVWSITGGTSSALGTSSTTNSVIWDGAVGQYTLTVYAINPTTGCAGNNKTIVINVVALGITITGPTTICPHTDNQTGDFEVTVTYTGTGAWSFTINDGVTDKTYSVSNGTTSYKVTIPGYTNTSATATADHIIKITSVTTTGGTVKYDGTEANAANHSITIAVHPTPATSDIIQN
jgi:hypothetical protein